MLKAFRGRGLARSTTLAVMVAAATLGAASAAAQAPLTAASPDLRNVIVVDVRGGGLGYSVARDGRAVVTRSDDWYLGAIADEEARTLDVPLALLTPGKRYAAESYADGPGADWRTDPLPAAISTQPVTSASRLRVALARGGGQAIRLRAVK